MDPVSEVHGIFSNRHLSSTSDDGSTKSSYNSVYVFGSLLDSPDQQLKSGLFMSGIGVFAGWIWLLEGALSTEKGLLKLYVYMYA